jgi:hypothetical protein
MTSLNISKQLKNLRIKTLKEYFEKFPCPENITTLICCYNDLTDLVGCPENITTIHCENNNISNFNGSPSNLYALFACENKFVNLVGCPESIKILDLTFNYTLQSFQGLPIGIKNLQYSMNNYCKEYKINTLGVSPQLLKDLGFNLDFLYEVILKNNGMYITEIPIADRTKLYYIIAVSNNFPFDQLPQEYKTEEFCLELIEKHCAKNKIPKIYRTKSVYQEYSKKYSTLKIPRKFINSDLCLTVCSDKYTELVNVPMYLRTNKIIKAALKRAFDDGYLHEE